jgi:hypothetical protein
MRFLTGTTGGGLPSAEATFMDLVLAAIHLEASPRAVPLGPAMLASALKRAFGGQVRTRVVDLFLQDSPEACAGRILESAPAAVGFSMYVWNRGLALATARELKRRQPGLVIFAGGAEATADLQGVLADPAMDFVLPGEAEELIVAAVAGLRAGASPGDLQAGLVPGPVRDLATLASPFLDGTLDPAAYTGQLWELSRGCPFTCDFCFESRGETGTRRIPMARVQAELECFVAARVSQVFVLDPTFNFHRAQAKEVLRLIARTAPDIHFFFEIRSEFLDRELARLFAGIRCTLQIGLQSAEPAVLKRIGRTLDPRDFQAKILLLHQAGVTYGFDLIHGLPGDTLVGWMASLDFALAMAPNHLDLFRLSVLPGTRLRETAAGFGLDYQAGHPYQVLATPGFSGAELDQAGRIARACDRFYNDGKAVPWFGIVQGALELAPSELFARFTGHLDAHPGADVTTQQREFLTAQFQGQRPAMATVAADLATWFGACAGLAEAAGRDPESPHQREARFNHDPRALVEQLGAGITELEDLSYILPPEPCSAVLRWDGGQPVLGSVTAVR